MVRALQPAMTTQLQKPATFRARFGAAAANVSKATGSAWASSAAILIIVAWAVTGPIFGFSDTWQLVINTGTSIVTFLMVFLIQNSQNREAKATQLKLDELIRAVSDARNQFIGAERDPEEQLDEAKRDVEAAKSEPSAGRPSDVAPGEPSHNGQPR